MEGLRLIDNYQPNGGGVDNVRVVYDSVNNIVWIEGKQPKLITFYVNNYDRELLEYQAEEGMTWYEWCNSPYNYTSDGWYVNESEYDFVTGNGEDWGYGGQYDMIVGACGTCIIESNKIYQLYKDGWGLGGGDGV